MQRTDIQTMAEWLMLQEEFRNDENAIAGRKLTVAEMYARAEEEATRKLANPWCVALNVGTDAEYVEATQHASYTLALKEVCKARKAGYAADVMKRRPDGTLTTEF